MKPSGDKCHKYICKQNTPALCLAAGGVVNPSVERIDDGYCKSNGPRNQRRRQVRRVDGRWPAVSVLVQSALPGGSPLQLRIRDGWAVAQPQDRGIDLLQVMRRNNPRAIADAVVRDLAAHDYPVSQTRRHPIPQLRGAWNRGLSGVAGVIRRVQGVGGSEWLCGHAGDRPRKQQPELFTGQLPVGYANC